MTLPYSLLISSKSISGYGIATNRIRKLLDSIDGRMWFESSGRDSMASIIALSSEMLVTAKQTYKEVNSASRVRVTYDWEDARDLIDIESIEGSMFWPRDLATCFRSDVRNQIGKLRSYFQPPIWPKESLTHPFVTNNYITTNMDQFPFGRLVSDSCKHIAWMLVCELHYCVHNAVMWELLRQFNNLRDNPYEVQINCYLQGGFPLSQTSDQSLWVFVP